MFVWLDWIKNCTPIGTTELINKMNKQKMIAMIQNIFFNRNAKKYTNYMEMMKSKYYACLSLCLLFTEICAAPDIHWSLTLFLSSINWSITFVYVANHNNKSTNDLYFLFEAWAGAIVCTFIHSFDKVYEIIFQVFSRKNHPTHFIICSIATAKYGIL